MADIKGKVVWRSDPNDPNSVEAGLRVEIWKDKVNDLAPLGAASTDATGYFVIPKLKITTQPRNRAAGARPVPPTTYEFAVLRDGEEISFVPQKRWINTELGNPVTLMVAPPKVDVLADSLRDLAAYNPTAYEVANGGQLASGGDKSSLDRIIDSAVTDVLGLRMKYDKPSILIDALGQVFKVDDTDGKRKIKYTPRTFTVETELGAAITGAQAVLYRYFSQTVESVLKSLAGLRPIGKTSDQEVAKAATEILRDTLQQLVSEVGRSGGPREARIDPLFDRIDNQITTLQREYKLRAKDVTVITEEQILTDFLIIVDQINAMRDSWNRYLTNTAAYLGTQFVGLSRGLTCVVTGVEEVYRALNAFGLSPSERQTINIVRVVVSSKPTFLTIEELLGWAHSLAAEVIPDAIQSGGKEGAKAVLAEAEDVRQYIDQAINTPASSHTALRQPRVVRSLKELVGHFDQIIYDIKIL